MVRPAMAQRHLTCPTPGAKGAWEGLELRSTQDQDRTASHPIGDATLHILLRKRDRQMIDNTYGGDRWQEHYLPDLTLQ